uniref:Ig-like domain-containing protein n=1 Tax=Gopherus agassizii TaxID=38772 RepID=A0A452HVB0_9SAUR
HDPHPTLLCIQHSRPWSYPKPSISVSPGGVIPIGGNVTIQCWHQRLGMRILPCKAGDGNYLTYTDPAGSEAEFPITSARREHGGSYTCRCTASPDGNPLGSALGHLGDQDRDFGLDSVCGKPMKGSAQLLLSGCALRTKISSVALCPGQARRSVRGRGHTRAYEDPKH